MAPPRRKPTSPPKRSHSALPLVLGSLLIGLLAARWLADRTRRLARTDWRDVPELEGASLSELALANGQSVALRENGRAHVLYLFQYDCAACDAQRAHVAELLEAVPSAQVVSATVQPASLSPGYWGDLGSSLAQPFGADSAWLAERHLDRTPLLLFIDPTGRIVRAVQGSVLSWSDHALLEALAKAGRA